LPRNDRPLSSRLLDRANKEQPFTGAKRNLKLWSPRAWCRIRWSDEIKAKNLQ
jgi:hypothetical protein